MMPIGCLLPNKTINRFNSFKEGAPLVIGPPPLGNNYAVICGKAIVKKGDSTCNVYSAFENVFRTEAVTNHDHIQYYNETRLETKLTTLSTNVITSGEVSISIRVLQN